MERLQKYMARCGVASRRKCEELIVDGKVKVNENIISELGFKVDPVNDKVYLRDSLIMPEEKQVYIAFNKPVGIVSTVKDEKGRKTLLDIVKVEERIYPIGRLDYDTSGLILLTNDGDVYNNIIHPRKQINKIYLGLLRGIPTADTINEFCSGLVIDGYVTSDAGFEILKKYHDTCEVKITIHEGRNRQIRKMCDVIGYPVLKLKRLSVGKIELGKLKSGEWRYLSSDEVDYLKTL